MAQGKSRIRQPLRSADTAATLAAARSLGIAVEEAADGTSVRVTGQGLVGFRQPDDVIDCGNSGTTARLLMGALAGQPLRVSLTGDDSLRSRPMERVAHPLGLMGASVRFDEHPGRLPLTIAGGPLESIDYPLPVASAQVKSALLLAGLTGRAFVLLTEPGRSRDHSERLLGAMGVSVISHQVGTGWRVELRDPPPALEPLDLTVPGDVSSAAFFAVWALLQPGREPLRLTHVGLNPTRTGFLTVLARMGGRIQVEMSEEGVEPVGDVVVWPSSLEGATVEGREVPSLVDEVPLLAVVAARADGVTRIRGASELRVKESDRLAAISANLRAIGVGVEEYDDGLDIEGTGRPPTGRVNTFGDHRIEMAFAVLGASPGAEIEIEGARCADVSFPGFWEALQTLSDAPRGRRPSATVRRRPVVTIDGPAGSGKSTTAREVARRLGLVHLDSGALYRAITLASIRGGVPDDELSSVTADEWRGFDVDVAIGKGGLEVRIGGTVVPDAELRSPAVTARVSRVAALPAVRDCLLGLQRAAAAGGGLVADGRDMGTIVFPEADVKVFITADLEARARRRLLETGGDIEDAGGVTGAAAELQRRDFQDTHREHSPLRVPEDATVIDTTDRTIEDQIAEVVRLVEAAEAGS